MKKSWDSFNIALVVIAILFGIFARRNDDGSSNVSLNTSTKTTQEEEEEPTKIYDYDHVPVPDTSQIWPPVTGVTRLKRNSSSYPDLRQESIWETGDQRFRCFDDFEINNNNNNKHYNYNPVRPRSFGPEQQEEVEEAKEIQVDTFQLRSSSPAPPPPPPPPPPAHQKPKRTYETVSRKEKAKQNDTQFKEVKEKDIHRTPPPAPPPPPIPTPSPARVRSEQRYGKKERRKSNVKKEIEMVLATIYSQTKRNKNKKKSKDLYDESLRSQAEPAHSTRPPPPPPPPPQPPSVFYSLFKKGLSITKKVHSVSVSTPPKPPPPPPLPSSSSKKKTWVPPETHRQRSSTMFGRPPLPTRANNRVEIKRVNVNVGVNSEAQTQSPFIPMPPPPPPPQFKMPEMRFAVRGDFVKIRSAQSSRCGSPELEDVDASSSVSLMDGGDRGDGSIFGVGGPGFCPPSPDVNIKADSFIARFHDGLRLEKMNSWREKQNIGLRP